MNRVIVIGSGGAGKSTLAPQIGEILGLPVIHLDREFWRPNWMATPEDEWIERVRELVARERWVMDGNFGGTSGMTEMVLQSYNDEILILPALPKAWPTGSVKGLKARGGIGLDLAWRDGVPERLTLRAKGAIKTRLVHGEQTLDIALKAGETANFGYVDGKLSRA